MAAARVWAAAAFAAAVLAGSAAPAAGAVALLWVGRDPVVLRGA